MVQKLDPLVDVAVDVLICGAGPAGYMAALTLARYGVSHRVIDMRPTRTQTGQAGGVQPRTSEILHTLNLQHQLDIQGNHVSEMAFWAFGDRGKLERTHVGPEIQNATRYPYILSIPQRETERAFDEELNRRGYFVDRPTELINFTYTDDVDFPVHVLVKNLYTNITTTYRAKYLLGTDGATSKTREILGFDSIKQGEDDVWCVADVQLDTDFPDIRRRSAIRSPHGGMMFIPNPNDTNRIYTQLNTKDLQVVQTNGVEHEAAIKLNPSYSDTALYELVQDRISAVLSPYKLKIKKLFWISQYRVRQRIVKEFWDRKRAIIVGDACHTHSPKAAQGLNTSVADAYNLTWKLALVLKGKASTSLLDTYALERRQIAEELIDFDSKFAHLFGRKDFLDNSNFHDVYEKAQGFTSGVGQQYEPGPLTEAVVTVPIAKNSLEPLTPGKRLYTMRVLRHIDGIVLDILDDMPSNGRFHIFVFAGNAISRGALGPVAKYLASEESALSIFNKDAEAEFSFENIYVANAKNDNRLVDMFLVHTDNHHDINIPDLPAPFPLWKHRIYVDKQGVEHKCHGVDIETGALVLVRPDGHISMVVGLEEGRKITDLLKTFLFT